VGYFKTAVDLKKKKHSNYKCLLPKNMKSFSFLKFYLLKNITSLLAINFCISDTRERFKENKAHHRHHWDGHVRNRLQVILKRCYILRKKHRNYKCLFPKNYDKLELFKVLPSKKQYFITGE
jgi:hypothetical protein